VLAIVVPSIFLEMLLVRISGRPFLLSNVFLSALFVIAGIIGINADRRRPKAAMMGQLIRNGNPAARVVSRVYRGWFILLR
jgi:hypothetical protein